MTHDYGDRRIWGVKGGKTCPGRMYNVLLFQSHLHIFLHFDQNDLKIIFYLTAYCYKIYYINHKSSGNHNSSKYTHKSSKWSSEVRFGVGSSAFHNMRQGGSGSISKSVQKVVLETLPAYWKLSILSHMLLSFAFSIEFKLS